MSISKDDEERLHGDGGNDGDDGGDGGDDFNKA